MPDTPYTASSNPSTDGFPVTPSDSTVFSKGVRGLYIGVGGNVRVRTIQGTMLTFLAVPTGTIMDWVVVDQVHTTGTTATNIIAVY